MTPEEQRRQNELYDLKSTQEHIQACEQQITFLQREYEVGLNKARDSEPKWEDLKLGQIVERAVGLEKTEVAEYEEGSGKNLKEQMAHEQKNIEKAWKYLQTNYGIQPNDTAAPDRAIAERKQPTPMSPEEYQQKQERLENLKAYRNLRNKLTNEIKEAQAELADPYSSRSAEEKALLQNGIAENQSRIATLDKVARERYGASPTVINKLEEELRNAVPTQQATPLPQPQAPTNPKPSEPAQPLPQVAPSTQDTPTQPSGEPAQPPKETKPKASFRELFEQPALGERQTVDDYWKQQHEQVFQRQMDQYYESQPPSQPTPAPKQPGHLKDLQPTTPQQPPPTDKPTSQQPEGGHFIDLFTQGEQLQDIAQGIEQMKADMAKEQGAQPTSGKTLFRQLFEQRQEPPHQEQERDRSR